MSIQHRSRGASQASSIRQQNSSSMTAANGKNGTSSQNNTLVIFAEETPLSEIMGAEIVTVLIGPEQKMFTVHKQLITATSTYFDKLFENSTKNQSAFVIKDVLPGTFELFIEFLYTRRVPSLLASHPRDFQATRLRDLCLLFSFAERGHLHEQIQGKIMDAIRAGFLTFGGVPEENLIRNIYKKTTLHSKLRKFCAEGLVYTVQTADSPEKLYAVASLVNDIDEVMDDFMKAVSEIRPVRDPRVKMEENS